MRSGGVGEIVLHIGFISLNHSHFFIFAGNLQRSTLVKHNNRKEGSMECDHLRRQLYDAPDSETEITVSGSSERLRALPIPGDLLCSQRTQAQLCCEL